VATQTFIVILVKPRVLKRKCKNLHSIPDIWPFGIDRPLDPEWFCKAGAQLGYLPYYHVNLFEISSTLDRTSAVHKSGTQIWEKIIYRNIILQRLMMSLGNQTTEPLDI
jgi:hypothetical protein